MPWPRSQLPWPRSQLPWPRSQLPGPRSQFFLRGGGMDERGHFRSGGNSRNNASHHKQAETKQNMYQGASRIFSRFDLGHFFCLFVIENSCTRPRQLLQLVWMGFCCQLPLGRGCHQQAQEHQFCTTHRSLGNQLFFTKNVTSRVT